MIVIDSSALLAILLQEPEQKTYGKGIDPKANLDCAAYALAKTLDAPLLFKGNDFAATDVQQCS
jgi:uncharacterized protein with PIN domain